VNGPEAPGPDAASPSEAQQDADWVITTVVGGNDADQIEDEDQPAWAQARLARTETPPPPVPPEQDEAPAGRLAQDEAVAGRLAEVEARLTALEGLPDAVGALRQAAGQEFQRCVGLLAGHDRTLVEVKDALAAVVGQLESVEAREISPPVPPSAELAPQAAALYEQALGHVLEQLEGFEARLQSVDSGATGGRLAGIEERLAALAPLPAVVQALRTVVRTDEEMLAAEILARQSEQGSGAVTADDLQPIVSRLAAVEGRLAPLETTPEDVVALGRIVRRELDAVTADVQTREQVLRRALQKEIERLHDSAEAREEALRETVQGLDLVERRLRGTTQSHEDALAATNRRVEGMESRLVSIDALAEDVDTLRTAARREMERLRASTQTHDQSIAETAKRIAAIDERLARVDALPGEVQSLRSAIRQDGERSMVGLRSIEERTRELAEKTSRQLRQLADAVTEDQQRRARLAADIEWTRATVRSMEVALAEVTERLDTLAAPPPVPPAPLEPEPSLEPEPPPAPDDQPAARGPEG